MWNVYIRSIKVCLRLNGQYIELNRAKIVVIWERGVLARCDLFAREETVCIYATDGADVCLCLYELRICNTLVSIVSREPCFRMYYLNF